MAAKEEKTTEIRIPKEHAPLDYLLSQIPKKAQKGMLIQCDLHLMSIDANEHFIVLGSNVGVIFLYNRKDKGLERLRTHSHNDVICCVALHSGLEHQIAAATEKGVVYLFQLPSKNVSQSKQLQQFIVKDIHKSVITSMCWSLNGMKMFTGDKKGQVSCTEVDFYAGVCETNICMIENGEIVQLNHAHKALLISTNQRTVIYRTDTKAGLTQVGQKERKIFGRFGAIFLPGLCKPDDAELYACRPGLRIWKAKMDGSVQSTYLYKELVNNPHTTLELIPFHHKAKMFLPENQFGPLYLYDEKYIVTYFESSLFVLNPLDTSVICGTFHLGNIRGVAVINKEIFVLRKDTDRNVIRIAERPESLGGNTYHRLVKDHNMPDFMSTHGKDETQNTQASISPLKFLKENVVDKIIPVDLSSEKNNSVSNLASSVENSMNKSSEKETSPKDLPPIVKLDNPDLLSIEIFAGAPTTEHNTVIQSPIRRDRFNPFMKEDAHDDDAELDTSKLPKDHSSPKQSSLTLEDQTKPLSGPGTANHGTSPLHGRGRIEAIPITMPTDDIAISVKHKKKKKKKTVNPDSSKPPSHVDSDTISQNSTETGVIDQSEGSEISHDHLNSGVDISDIVGLKPKDIISDKFEVHASDNDDKTFNAEVKPDAINSQNVLQSTTEDSITKESPKPIENSINKDDNAHKGSDSDLKEKTSNDSKQKNTEQFQLVKAQMKVENTNIEEKLTVQSVESNSQIESKEQSITSNTIQHSSPNKGLKPQSSLETESTIGKKSQDLRPVSPLPERKIPLPSETKPILSKGIDNRHNAKESIESFFSHSDKNLDVVEKVTKINKKHSSFSKLEKNLASLEQGLDFYGASDSYILKSDSKDKDSSLNSSYEDSGNGSMLNQSCTSTTTNNLSEKHLADSSDSTPSPLSPSNTVRKMNRSNSEDFYSMYNTPAPSQSESGLQESSDHPLSNVERQESEETFDDKLESVQVCDQQLARERRSSQGFNTWTELSFSGNLQSLQMSDTHIWCTDKSCNIWYSSLKTPGVKWVKASGGYAKQIAVSRSGMIVWKLYRETVFAGTKITGKHPEGMKWVEAVKGVQTIAVDNNCAWYLKTNGEVAMQKGLSKDRPCYRSTFIQASEYKINSLACRAWVVWAITDQCKLIYRAGVKKDLQEGKEWAEYVHPDGMMFSTVSFGDGNVAWAVDILGRIFFMTNVTMETPIGDGCWWQVPVNTEVTATDYTYLDTIKSLAKVFDPQKLADLISTQKGGLIAAGTSGVWVCPEFKNMLLICKGSVEGQIWNEVHLSGILASIAWKLISVAAIHLEWGLIWAQQANGEIFTFSQEKKSLKTIERPPKGQFVCLSVCEEAVWGLTESGKVYIRSGMDDYCPEGAKWCDLDLKQLGDAQLVHLSCGSRNVWAVDSEGVIYQRIGVKAPSTHSLPSAWLPVDSGPKGTVFIQVYTGPTDTMVWAVDNRRQTYVRQGVTDSMPIGTSWLLVPGVQAHQLAISGTFVWALDPNGEIRCRHGITEDNPAGDFWRRIPGIFLHISCSRTDQLWAISREGMIYSRKTKYLLRGETQEDTQRQRNTSSLSITDDWELV